MILEAIFPYIKEDGLQFDIPLTWYGILGMNQSVETHLVPCQKNSGLHFCLWNVLWQSEEVVLVASSRLTAPALSLVCRA